MNIELVLKGESVIIDLALLEKDHERHTAAADHTATTIEKVKHGEAIRFKLHGPVYYKGDYCRENKGWFCDDSRDISNAKLAKKGKLVFIDFDY